MQDPDNLLVKLHRLARRQDENFTTEAFSRLLRHLLREAPWAADRVLERLTGLKAGSESSAWSGAVIDTQFRTPFGTPDIRIDSSSALVFVEVKVEAELAEGQTQSYLRALEETPAAPETRRLVLLTRYPASASLAAQAHQTRWYEIAEELEGVTSENLPQVTRHLVEQFLGFLGQRGMALLPVRSGISAGIRRYEERLGDQSIFSCSRVKSLSRIVDEEDLRPLHDLLLAMGSALEQCGLFGDAFLLDSGKHEGGWIGYNIGRMRYFFYVWLNAPELLTFQAFEAPVDPGRHEDSTGRIYESWGRTCWDRQLDLSSKDVAFFSASKADQQAKLIEFLKETHEFARALE